MGEDFHDIVHVWAREPPALVRYEAERVRQWVTSLVCQELDCARYGVSVDLIGSIRNGTHTESASDIDIAIVPRNCRCDETSCDVAALSTGWSEICEPLALRWRLRKRLIATPGLVGVREQEHSLGFSITGIDRPVDLVVLVPKAWPVGLCVRCGRPSYALGYEVRSNRGDQCAFATWPDHHSSALDAYDKKTGGRYRPVVRAVKSFHRVMKDNEGYGRPSGICGVMLESLLAHAPEGCYWGTGSCCFNELTVVTDRVESALYDPASLGEMQDLSGRRLLFDGDQRWSIDEARVLLRALRRCIATRALSFG